MKVLRMTEMLVHYTDNLAERELSKSTIAKYAHDINIFLKHIRGKDSIEKQHLIEFKELLLDKHKVCTVNSYLISLNGYLSWLGAPELMVKTVRMQKKTCLNNVISREEYFRLLEYCMSSGKTRDYLLIRTIAGTGIRVGELRYITYEAIECGKAEIHHKGKCRSVFIPGGLSALLASYCAENNITGGVIFKGRKRGEPLCPSSVWKILKRAAAGSGADASIVYPHNLRHLFAKTYMQRIGNLFELADLLGHAYVETTRIYALSSVEDKQRSLDKLDL